MSEPAAQIRAAPQSLQDVARDAIHIVDGGKQVGSLVQDFGGAQTHGEFEMYQHALALIYKVTVDHLPEIRGRCGLGQLLLRSGLRIGHIARLLQRQGAGLAAAQVDHRTEDAALEISKYAGDAASFPQLLLSKVALEFDPGLGLDGVKFGEPARLSPPCPELDLLVVDVMEFGSAALVAADHSTAKDLEAEAAVLLQVTPVAIHFLTTAPAQLCQRDLMGQIAAGHHRCSWMFTLNGVAWNLHSLRDSGCQVKNCYNKYFTLLKAFPHDA